MWKLETARLFTVRRAAREPRCRYNWALMIAYVKLNDFWLWEWVRVGVDLDLSLMQVNECATATTLGLSARLSTYLSKKKRNEVRVFHGFTHLESQHGNPQIP
jgi:hypothetical protein